MISIKEFIEWAKVSWWNIKENEKCDVNLSNEVRERYKVIPHLFSVGDKHFYTPG